MRREDIEKLLGGYATGTLSEAERKALFEAALADQSLFDSLAQDQALKEVFDDPACRARLAASLEPPRGMWGWLRRPAVWTLAGSLAGTTLLGVVLMRSWNAPVPPPQVAMRAPAPPVQEAEPREPAAKREAAAAARPKSANALRAPAVTGGTVGGVIGGIVAAPPPAVAEARPQDVSVPVTAQAPPPAPAGHSLAMRETARTFQAAEASMVRPAAASFVPRSPLRANVERQNADGSFAGSPSGQELPAGAAVRLSVESDRAGYLYVLWRTSPGTLRVLFPAAGESNRIAPGQPLRVPASGGFRFDGEPGEKQVVLAVTPQPEPGFKTGVPADAAMARLRPGRRAGMAATGVVRAGAPDAAVAEISLRFR